MEFFKTYHEVVMKAMENATKTNEDAIEKGAKLMADAVQNGHTLYTFCLLYTSVRYIVSYLSPGNTESETQAFHHCHYQPIYKQHPVP